METKPFAGVLADTQLFRGLKADELKEAMVKGRVRHLTEGVEIFAQGAPAERAHILLEGRVRILQTDSGGAQVLMRFIGPGETFGTVGLFTDHRYPAHAVTVTDCLEITWRKAELLDLMSRVPQVSINLVGVIGARLQEAQNRLREVATQRVERRIANALLRLATQAGKAAGDGTKIDFPLSRKDVAEMCGATLHTVSRTLKSWEKQKFLHTHRQRLTIHNIEEIRRRAEDCP